MAQDRYQQGWEKLKEIDGEAGERVIESLKDIAPDLARYTIEFPFGDVYSRAGLDLKSRERLPPSQHSRRLAMLRHN
jgi:4-carboxymuconolactone decarboxylase